MVPDILRKRLSGNPFHQFSEEDESRVDIFIGRAGGEVEFLEVRQVFDGEVLVARDLLFAGEIPVI